MEFKNIREGWLNYAKFLIKTLRWDPGMGPMVAERAKLCVECPELKTMDGKVDSLIGPHFPGGDKLPLGQCVQCGCVFPMLIFAPDKKCPLKKW